MDIINFKKANCKNCFKCLRECPVKAIGFKNGQAEILTENCLICGHCLNVCPQNAKKVRNDVGAVKAVIASGKKVIASVAPSFIAAFPYKTLPQFEQVLKALGFSEAQETSVGAAAVTREYERLLSACNTPVLISTACPTIVRLVEKYYPEALTYLADTVSPMTAHARMIKKEMGDVSVVFIGPCISKKDEATWDSDAVDYALTFEELEGWIKEAGVSVDTKVPDTGKAGNVQKARFYPVPGGIIKSLSKIRPDVSYISISGISKCRDVLEKLVEGNLHGYFIEMSACEDSCISGPHMLKPAGGIIESIREVTEYSQSETGSDFPDMEGIDLHRSFKIQPAPNQQPGEMAIAEILAKTGKKCPQDELNCGACGYSTCREKAIAVYQGKAELNMCMPYMRERAEFISDNVIAFTPNAIIVLDSFLNIQAYNQAAANMFGIDSVHRYKGSYIGELTESSLYEEALIRKKNILDKRIYLFKNDKYVELSVIYVPEHNIIFGLYKDLTEERIQTEKLNKVKIHTIETADRVIEKQMRIAQEIAMLLGESTAETKIALTKLKETMMPEEG